MNKKTTTFYATQILENHSLLILKVTESRRSVRDLTSETSKGSKTRLYQIVHTTDSVFLIVELAITRSKMGLETSLFLLMTSRMPLITCYAKLYLYFSDLRSLLPRSDTNV